MSFWSEPLFPRLRARFRPNSWAVAVATMVDDGNPRGPVIRVYPLRSPVRVDDLPGRVASTFRPDEFDLAVGLSVVVSATELFDWVTAGEPLIRHPAAVGDLLTSGVG